MGKKQVLVLFLIAVAFTMTGCFGLFGPQEPPVWGSNMYWADTPIADTGYGYDMPPEIFFEPFDAEPTQVGGVWHWEIEGEEEEPTILVFAEKTGWFASTVKWTAYIEDEEENILIIEAISEYDGSKGIVELYPALFELLEGPAPVNNEVATLGIVEDDPAAYFEWDQDQNNVYYTMSVHIGYNGVSPQELNGDDDFPEWMSISWDIAKTLWHDPGFGLMVGQMTFGDTREESKEVGEGAMKAEVDFEDGEIVSESFYYWDTEDEEWVLIEP